MHDVFLQQVDEALKNKLNNYGRCRGWRYSNLLWSQVDGQLEATIVWRNFLRQLKNWAKVQLSQFSRILIKALLKLQRSWKKHVVLIINTCMMQFSILLQLWGKGKRYWVQSWWSLYKPWMKFWLTQSLCKNFPQ